MNAFTSREHTAYYTRLPARELALGLDLLVDVVVRTGVPGDEVEAEREVILEELAVSQDTPDDRVHTALIEALFPDHPLGCEVLGADETIDRPWPGTTSPGSTSAGTDRRPRRRRGRRVDHDDVVDRVPTASPAARGDGLAAADAAGRSVCRVATSTDPRAGARRPGLALAARDDPDRYALAVANQVLGGGMSSRLFQEIREERGLAYSVYSSPRPTATAAASRSTPAPRRRAGEVLELIDGEVDGLARRRHHRGGARGGPGLPRGLAACSGSRTRAAGWPASGWPLSAAGEIIAGRRAPRRHAGRHPRRRGPRASPGARRTPGRGRRRPVRTTASRRTSAGLAPTSAGRVRAMTDDGSGCSGPVGGWAPRCAGPSPTIPTSSWWPRSTRTTPGSTCARSPRLDVPDLQIAPSAEALGEAEVDVAVDFTAGRRGPRRTSPGPRPTASTPWSAPPASPTTTSTGSRRRSPTATA